MVILLKMPDQAGNQAKKIVEKCMLIFNNYLMTSQNLVNGGMGEIENRDKFFFFGDGQQLRRKLEAMTDEQCQQYVEGNIVLTGQLIQGMNTWSFICTCFWGCLTILPLFLMCLDCWKKCTYPAWTIAPNVYMSLGRLLRGPNFRNITLSVIDNTFDKTKAQILYNLIAESRMLKGFTFTNICGTYNFDGNEWSDFVDNMRPIKQLHNVTSDISWGSQIVFA